MRAYGRDAALARGATDVEGYALRAAAHAAGGPRPRRGWARVRRAELLALREVARRGARPAARRAGAHPAGPLQARDVRPTPTATR